MTRDLEGPRVPAVGPPQSEATRRPDGRCDTANQCNGTKAAHISLEGVVQGVGFRPFVYRLATEWGLAGWVLNHSGGVDIEVEGPSVSLDRFLHDLEFGPPPLARITSIRVEDHNPVGLTQFEIRESREESGRYQLISPDVATCPDCLRELLDPSDRRYRYPFTNCTNCGPRFTIISDIPYDRPNTTMGRFKMCPQCQQEYDDPLDRRFHAQPNACPTCGPRVWLVSGPDIPLRLQKVLHSLTSMDERDPVAQTAALLREGAIVAIKGLGGFHLACDATNASAVCRLRERKRRPNKPLAVMITTLDRIECECDVSPQEERLLTSRECPIVLLPWHRDSEIAPGVAPGYGHLGVMLPYTPLHHVLLRDVDRPLVMTSGNLSEEPICQTNEEALRRLAHVADAFLLHDRDIYARYDDSVWTVFRSPAGSRRDAPDLQETSAQCAFPQPLRRSRGYAPYPVTLPFESVPTLAVGAQLKNTFCLSRDRFAFLSQHIGELENLETLEHFHSSIQLLQHLFRVEPERIAYDQHPDYLSTRFAVEQASAANLDLMAVQHHHAHIASCLADNGWRTEDGPVIGIAWDGTGYGVDGHIWGGEWLLADYQRFQRLAHLEYLPLPGGDTAIRKPYRVAVGYLAALGIPVESFRALSSVPVVEMTLLHQQVERGINTPLTSSAGRLFDAVSALLGVCQQSTYEAEAAIRLEQVSGSGMIAADYPWHAGRVDGEWIVRLGPLFAALARDGKEGADIPQIGARFHDTMAGVIADISQRIRQDTGLNTVALSGGCFQNRRLFGQAVARLREADFRVLVHHQVPTNDGGISLGQTAVANAL